MDQNNIAVTGNDLHLRRVLISRLSALGDVVMTLPVIYSACLCYPGVQFTLVTSKAKSSIFINKPVNLKVVGAEIRNDYKGFGGARRLLNELSAEGNFDAFIDLQNDKSTRWLRMAARFKGIKTIKFNNAQSHKQQLSRRTNKVMLPLVSSRDRYIETFFKAGLPLQERFTGLYGKEQKAPIADYASITTPKEEGTKWVGIAPFAMYSQKEYPIEKMTEVIDMLSRLPHIKMFILGAAGREEKQAQLWQDKYPSVTSLAGKNYGFPAELALISNLDVLLTMDSANMHLASIVRTPTISIWGATHHYCGFKGWHQSENDMIEAPLSCRPCSINGDKPCYRRDLLCLTAIRPDTIYTRLLEKMRK